MWVVTAVIGITLTSTFVESVNVYSDECPDLIIVPNLDIVKYQGKWFDLLLQKGSYFKCGVHEIEAAHINNEPNLLNITSNVLLHNGSDVVESGLYRKEATTRPKGYVLSHTDSWFHYLDGYILETDYDTYSVALTCEAHKGQIVESVWITSKSKTISEETRAKSLDVLKRNNIKIEMDDVYKNCGDYYSRF